MLSRRDLFPTWERSPVLLGGLWFGSVLGKGSAANKHPSAVALGSVLTQEELRAQQHHPRTELHSQLNKSPVDGFSAGLIRDNDLYRWEVMIIGPPDTLYEGGVFKAHLTFPKDYPLRPPKMKFITDIWHPNAQQCDSDEDVTPVKAGHKKWTQACDSEVDKNGDVCISILHEPREDKYGYEKPEERWLPIHTVETIMISVISMLADPNSDSPANVDAQLKAVSYVLNE
ncbi:Ubiquitin-conjugating enzyme E2 G1 [Takifugu flavidus]|uniref:Ubiquitin-conjugating enzyme E2 G1 n=1 Tax=Takifugu flavidus TaxID=433684 RepID=A0A5C6P7J0_9TELE|nr:Ubiquitin-conjugating enzyme E2 G1 [Takifugu flavidus]